MNERAGECANRLVAVTAEYETLDATAGVVAAVGFVFARAAEALDVPKEQATEMGAALSNDVQQAMNNRFAEYERRIAESN